MTMECRDQNIPPSFNNVGQNFTFLLKSGYVAIISCFATLPLPTIAGEYFNPHLLEVNETGTTSVDLSYISQKPFLRVNTILIFILTKNLLLPSQSDSPNRVRVMTFLHPVSASRS